MNKICGIYKITSPSGKIYVGQSKDIKTRWSAYKGMGKKLKGQPKIYNSLLKYSAEEHIFEILEECSIEELNVREDYWQCFFKVLGDSGLNCKKVNLEGQVGGHSEETKQKIKDTKRNKPRPIEKPGNFGNKWTDEQKKKASDRVLKSGKNKGENNPMFGKFGILSPNFGKKYPNKSKKGLRYGKDNKSSVLVLDTQTGIFYFSIKEASNAYNIKYPTLVLMLRGAWKNKTNLIRC